MKYKQNDTLWPTSNLSLRYQYIVNETGNENKYNNQEGQAVPPNILETTEDKWSVKDDIGPCTERSNISP